MEKGLKLNPQFWRGVIDRRLSTFITKPARFSGLCNLDTGFSLWIFWNLMPTQQPNRRERRKQKTRADLKQATIELLIEQGFDQLTIQQITDRADLARATFYLHFGDVEEAVWAVLADIFTELNRVIWEIDEDGPVNTPTDQKRLRYRKWIRLFEFVKQERELLAAVLGQHGHLKLVQRTTQFMAHSLQSDLTSGRAARTTELPIEFEAQFYTGGVMQIIGWWLSTGFETTPVELADMVYHIVLREPPPTR